MNYLYTYSTFKDVATMDEAIEKHINFHYYELNVTARQVLHVMAGYACKYVGALHVKAATIAERIGKSEKTVRRAWNLLQSLGILRKIQTKRQSSGGYGANIFQILPFDYSLVQSYMSSRQDASEISQDSAGSESESEETFYPLKQHLKELQEETAQLDDTFLAGKMPEELFQAFRPFYNAKGVYDIYGVLLRAKALVNKDILLEDWAPEYIQAFKAAIFNYK